MNYVIHGREPEDALHYFEDICAIPHGSGNEQAISNYLYHFFETQGLTVKKDEMGNLYARKEGSPGYEHLPAILLQGHMDMVCEKNSDTIHDFEKDPLQLFVDGNFLRAKGTTLGADDGTAVAYMMAIASRKDLVHPPVEMLITVQEETGRSFLLYSKENDKPRRVPGRVCLCQLFRRAPGKKLQKGRTHSGAGTGNFNQSARSARRAFRQRHQRRACKFQQNHGAGAHDIA